MTEDTVRVRVAGGEFRYDREHYEHGEELEVHERALEKHPRTLEAVDETETDSEDDASADAESGGDEEPDLEVDPDEIDPHPSELTVDELEERVGGVDDVATLEAIRHLEVESKDRTGAKDAIDARLDELEE